MQRVNSEGAERFASFASAALETLARARCCSSAALCGCISRQKRTDECVPRDHADACLQGCRRVWTKLSHLRETLKLSRWCIAHFCMLRAHECTCNGDPKFIGD